MKKIKTVKKTKKTVKIFLISFSVFLPTCGVYAASYEAYFSVNVLTI
jgi:hypothetical protein